VANSVDASYQGTARGPVMFTLSGVPAKDTSVAQLEQALRAEVERIAKDGVSTPAHISKRDPWDFKRQHRFEPGMIMHSFNPTSTY
ncbi:MAG: hypothetical protein ACKOAH_06320, partial [Pirellula sp.]